MAYYGFEARPVDYSFIAQAGAQIGSSIQQLPAAKEAMEKRKRFEENLVKLKLRKDQAEGVRQQRVGEMIEEYQQRMNIPQADERIKSKIESIFMSKMLLGDDVDASLKLMSDNDSKFEAWLNNQVSEKNKKEGASAAEIATKGGRQYGPEVDTGRGFTEQTLQREAPPAQYQEQAMARYGEMAARGEAPIQTTKELEQQPSIAAMQKTPPEQIADPLFDLKRRNLELKNATEMAREAALKAQAARARNQGRTEDVDKALKDVVSQRFTLDRSIRDDSKLISTLNKAITQVNEGGDNMEIMQSLTAAGYDGPIDAGSLQDLLIQTQKEQSNKRNDLATLKKAESALIKGGAGPLAAGLRSGQAQAATDKTNQLKSAVAQIKTSVSPGILKTGNMEQVISFLPAEYKNVMREKVDELKAEGYTDLDIRRWLSQ